MVDEEATPIPSYREKYLDMRQILAQECADIFSQIRMWKEKRSEGEQSHLVSSDSRNPGNCQEISSNTTAFVPAAATNHSLTPCITSGRAVVSKSLLLVHLPDIQQGEATYVSALPDSAESIWTRVVWHKDLQATYSIHDSPNPYVPSIIYRKKRSLQTSTEDDKKRQRLNTTCHIYLPADVESCSGDLEVDI